MLGSKSSYEPMRDNPTALDESAFAAGTVAAKFCSLGFVVSKKWFSGFVIVSDSLLRLYDDEKSYRGDPSSYILQISLSNHYQASNIQKKKHTQSTATEDLYSFYVEIDNGAFSPTRQLKLGFLDKDVASRFARAIKSNCSAL